MPAAATVTETQYLEKESPPPGYHDVKNDKQPYDTFNGLNVNSLNKLNSSYEKPGLEPSVSSEGSLTLSEDSGANVAIFIQNTLGGLVHKHKVSIVRLIIALVLIGYTVYFAFSVKHSVDGAVALICLTAITIFLMAYVWVRDHWGRTIYNNCMKPIGHFLDTNWYWLQW